MISQEQIKNALAAHGAWKARLKRAIETGRSEFSGAQVSVDNRCDFGKWLYGLPAEVQNGRMWKDVQQTHAEFHREAGRILTLALGGAKAEALAALDVNSTYGQLTGKLVILLNRWGTSAD